MKKNKKKMVHKMCQKCKRHLKKGKKAILIGGVILLLFGVISPTLSQTVKTSMLAQENGDPGIPPDNGMPPPDNGMPPPDDGMPPPDDGMPPDDWDHDGEDPCMGPAYGEDGERILPPECYGDGDDGEDPCMGPAYNEDGERILDPECYGDWDHDGEDPCMGPAYDESGERIQPPECYKDWDHDGEDPCSGPDYDEDGKRIQPPECYDDEDRDWDRDHDGDEDEYRDWEDEEDDKWREEEVRMDEQEKKRAKQEMKRRMRDIKYTKRDLKRMQKDLDRMGKRDEKRMGTADIEELEEIFADYKKAAEAKIAKLEKLPDKLEEAIQEDNRRIFWDYFEEMNRSGDDLLLESLRPKIDFFWRIQHFNDFGWEIEKIRDELIRITEDLGMDLDELVKEIGLDELIEIKEDIDAAIAASAEKLADLDEVVAQCLEDFEEYSDDEDNEDFWMIREDCWFELEDARENMWMELEDLDWAMEDNWEKMERIHQKMGFMHERYFIKEMIEEIKEGMKNVIRKLKEAEQEHPNVSFDRQWRLIEKGKKLLQEIQDKLERGQMEALNHIMPKFDRLGFEVEKAFRKLCERKNICIEPFEGVRGPGGGSYGPGPRGMFDRDTHIDNTIGRIGIEKGESLKEVIGRASEEDITLILQLILDLRPTAIDNLMEKAAGKYDDQVAKSLENIQYVPEEQQNDFLEIKGTLIDAADSLDEKVEELDGEKIILPGDVRKIEELQDDLVGKDFVSSEVVEELNAKVDEFIAEDYATRDEVSAKIEELEQKFEEMMAKDKGEKYKLGVNPSKDVDLDDWYHGYVKDGMDKKKFSGYKNERGELVGEFRPGNNVNKGEILKMAIENARVEPKMTEPLDDIVGIENFWGPEYVSTGRSLGLKVAWEIHSIEDLGTPATRGEVVRTVFEAAGFKEEVIKGEIDYATDFKDLPGDHPDFAFIEYAYESEVIGGDTDSAGNPLNTVRPWDPINRAETSKILETVESTIEYEAPTEEVFAVEEEKVEYEEFFDAYEVEIDFEDVDFENFDDMGGGKGPESHGGGGGGGGPMDHDEEEWGEGEEWEEEGWEEEEWDEEFEGAVMTVVVS